jgi:hypothetical protein
VLAGASDQSPATASEASAPTRFAGSPVSIGLPEGDTKAVLADARLRMDSGVCKVSRVSPDGRSIELFTMGQGTFQQTLSRGETLRLDPQGHAGEYSVHLTLLGQFPWWAIVSATGMMLVAVVAVYYWRRVSAAQFRWFWIGVGLWTVAVAVKLIWAMATHKAIIGFLKQHLSSPLLVASGGLYLGIQSSLCEIGLTLLAVVIWRQLGREAGRAIAIGVGAGAFEAFLLGAAQLAAGVMATAGLTSSTQIAAQLAAGAASTPLVWLVGPVERAIAILCHASCRALVLLGFVQRRPMMVFWGFAIFTLLDGIAGAAHVSGKLGTFSVWWIELAILPLALVNVPILRWCWRRGGDRTSRYAPT